MSFKNGRIISPSDTVPPRHAGPLNADISSESELSNFFSSFNPDQSPDVSDQRHQHPQRSLAENDQHGFPPRQSNEVHGTTDLLPLRIPGIPQRSNRHIRLVENPPHLDEQTCEPWIWTGVGQGGLSPAVSEISSSMDSWNEAENSRHGGPSSRTALHPEHMHLLVLPPPRPDVSASAVSRLGQLFGGACHGGITPQGISGMSLRESKTTSCSYDAPVFIIPHHPSHRRHEEFHQVQSQGGASVQQSGSLRRPLDFQGTIEGSFAPLRPPLGAEGRSRQLQHSETVHCGEEQDGGADGHVSQEVEDRDGQDPRSHSSAGRSFSISSGGGQGTPGLCPHEDQAAMSGLDLLDRLVEDRAKNLLGYQSPLLHSTSDVLQDGGKPDHRTGLGGNSPHGVNHRLHPYRRSQGFQGRTHSLLSTTGHVSMGDQALRSQSSQGSLPRNQEVAGFAETPSSPQVARGRAHSTSYFLLPRTGQSPGIHSGSRQDHGQEGSGSDHQCNPNLHSNRHHPASSDIIEEGTNSSSRHLQGTFQTPGTSSWRRIPVSQRARTRHEQLLEERDVNGSGSSSGQASPGADLHQKRQGYGGGRSNQEPLGIVVQRGRLRGQPNVDLGVNNFLRLSDLPHFVQILLSNVQNFEDIVEVGNVIHQHVCKKFENDAVMQVIEFNRVVAIIEKHCMTKKQLFEKMPL